MNKYLVRVWVEERVHNLRDVWIEADSISAIRLMSQQEFGEAIYEYEDIIDSDFSGGEGDYYDLDNLSVEGEDGDNITPSDEKPDVEDIHPDTGRGK